MDVIGHVAIRVKPRITVDQNVPDDVSQQTAMGSG